MSNDIGLLRYYYFKLTVLEKESTNSGSSNTTSNGTQKPNITESNNTTKNDSIPNKEKGIDKKIVIKWQSLELKSMDEDGTIQIDYVL